MTESPCVLRFLSVAHINGVSQQDLLNLSKSGELNCSELLLFLLFLHLFLAAVRQNKGQFSRSCFVSVPQLTLHSHLDEDTQPTKSKAFLGKTVEFLRGWSGASKGQEKTFLGLVL